MTEKRKEDKPLIYKVEPESGEQISLQQYEEEIEEQIEAEHSHKEEKIEQIKREFGVYEALAEVENEKANAIAWTQAYREQKQVENEPIQEQEIPRKNVRQQSAHEQQKHHSSEPQQSIHVQRETLPEKAVSKKRKKKKRESVTEVITRLTQTTAGSPPICEANLFGEKTKFQVLGMRGEVVKIRIGFRVRYIKLSDISQLKVISGE